MIDVVGILGPPSSAALTTVQNADLVVGGRRHLDLVAPSIGPATATLAIGADLGPTLDVVAQALDRDRRVCVLGSGDPGWFGIVRALVDRFGRDAGRSLRARPQHHPDSALRP